MTRIILAEHKVDHCKLAPSLGSGMNWFGRSRLGLDIAFW